MEACEPTTRLEMTTSVWFVANRTNAPRMDGSIPVARRREWSRRGRHPDGRGLEWPCRPACVADGSSFRSLRAAAEYVACECRRSSLESSSDGRTYRCAWEHARHGVLAVARLLTVEGWTIRMTLMAAERILVSPHGDGVLTVFGQVTADIQPWASLIAGHVVPLE